MTFNEKFGAVYLFDGQQPVFAYSLNRINEALEFDIKLHLFQLVIGEVYNVAFTMSTDDEIFAASSFEVNMKDPSITDFYPIGSYINITSTYSSDAIKAPLLNNDGTEVKIEFYLSKKTPTINNGQPLTLGPDVDSILLDSTSTYFVLTQPKK